MTTATDVKLDRVSQIEEAVETRDVEALFKLARLVKKEGDDEHSEVLIGLARRYDREDWAYDNANDN